MDSSMRDGNIKATGIYIQCCCGQKRFEKGDPVTRIQHNDYVHEVLGPEGNFCGTAIAHNISDAEKEIVMLENALVMSLHRMDCPDKGHGTCDQCIDGIREIERVLQRRRR